MYHSRRVRRWLLVLAALLLFFALFGFFAAPSIIKSQVQSRASAALHRPVTVGSVRFDPFTLRLQLDRLHVGERNGSEAFIDVDSIVVNASWASVFRRAPVLDALTLQHPRLHLRRTALQAYNFSDLLEPSGPPAADASPARFAIANIAIHDGDIQFRDDVQGTDHRVDQLQVGIPFVANLPNDTDIFVKPLLAMRVDGSPLHIEGQARPFAAARDSSITLKFDRLDLPRYLAYLPVALPVAIPKGFLSGNLDIGFLMTAAAPQLTISGTLSAESLQVTSAGQPLLELQQGSIVLARDEPLLSNHHLQSVSIDGLVAHVRRGPGGRMNLDALTAGSPPAARNDTPAQVRVDAITLKRVALDYTDASGATVVKLPITDLNGSLRGLSTAKGPAGSMDLSAVMAGGRIAAKGKLDLAGSRFDGDVDATSVALGPLWALAPPTPNATIDHGNLDLRGKLHATWGNAVNVQLQPGNATIKDLALGARNTTGTPITLASMNAAIASFDMASSQARLDSLTLTGLQLQVRRLRNGKLDLAAMAPPPSPAKGPAFQWSVDHLGLDDGKLTFTDASQNAPSRPVVLVARHFAIEGASHDPRKPLNIDLNGGVGKAGGFAITGKVTPQPAEADLKVKANGLNLAPLVPLITVPLNVNITGAQLALDGRLRYLDRGASPARVAYRGQATLGRVRVQDKLSGDDFLRFSSLAASGIDLRMGEGAPRVNLAGLALSDFYARVIVNATGRLNLADVVAKPETTPVSVTRAQDPASAKAVASATPPTPAAATSSAPGLDAIAGVPAPNIERPEVHIGQITLARGQLNYTDNFIKPNYTANITQLAGKIGAFGTADGPPADLVLQGQLDDSAPVDIGGSINPLTPVAFLDIKAKADGVELTGLSPYSGKYAGYPITKGRLTVDVHYNLDHGKLDADNHIFIDQLTFGDRIEGPGISHLPVKLAVALLKNSQGQIDVHVPVSGSLDDPHFSMGGLIWRAFVNLIARAVTSPFRLLASAGGSKQDLGYVEFAPGSSVLDAAAKSKLDDIAKVLADKKSLNLDVTGRTDPAKDEKGLREVTVQGLVAAEQIRDKEGDEAAADPETVKVDPADYDKYLEKAYKHAKFPKPKNFVGLAKSQPPDEMKTLLETNVPVDADALRHLAERRAAAVRQYLRGKVDDSRVFALAPKPDAKGIDDNGKTTRVDFGLH
jgi:uncharacterized protein DUF748